jgi:hypothetical protein
VSRLQVAIKRVGRREDFRDEHRKKCETSCSLRAARKAQSMTGMPLWRLATIDDMTESTNTRVIKKWARHGLDVCRLYLDFSSN